MLIYISPIDTAFIQRDLAMLRSNFNVFHFTLTDNPYLLPFALVLQFIKLMVLLPFTKKYLCFFAGYHTIIPVLLGKIFKKEVVIQCGGTDAMHLPQIDYGNYRKKWLKMATIFSFKNCTLILPVAKSLVKSDYFYDENAPVKQGLLNLIPGLKTNIMVVHNGFDPTFWFDTQEEKLPFSFITVASGISKKNRAMVKGIDLILAIAASFPHFNFTIVGDEKFQTELPNVTVTPALKQEKVRLLFQKTQFYLQLSSSEGFPNALAEAMLCGCIPIGSKVGEIPEIIGEAGFLLPTKNLKKLKVIFNKLNDIDLNELRRFSTVRIKEKFSYLKRKEILLNILSKRKR